MTAPNRETLGGLVFSILGCEWGRKVALPDDKLPCTRQAVQRLVLHDGPITLCFQFCAEHFAVVEGQTDPHRESADA